MSAMDGSVVGSPLASYATPSGIWEMGGWVVRVRAVKGARKGRCCGLVFVAGSGARWCAVVRGGARCWAVVGGGERRAVVGGGRRW